MNLTRTNYKKKKKNRIQEREGDRVRGRQNEEELAPGSCWLCSRSKFMFRARALGDMGEPFCP